MIKLDNLLIWDRIQINWYEKIVWTDKNWKLTLIDWDTIKYKNWIKK